MEVKQGLFPTVKATSWKSIIEFLNYCQTFTKGIFFAVQFNYIHSDLYSTKSQQLYIVE